MQGFELPVSEFDNDQAHIKGHVEMISFVQGSPQAQAEGLNTQALEVHIQAHQESAVAKSNALGNTKELGGNAAQLSNPEAGSIKQGTGQVATTPSEARA